MEEQFKGKLNFMCPRYWILENTEKYYDLKKEKKEFLERIFTHVQNIP